MYPNSERQIRELCGSEWVPHDDKFPSKLFEKQLFVRIVDVVDIHPLYHNPITI